MNLNQLIVFLKVVVIDDIVVIVVVALLLLMVLTVLGVVILKSLSILAMTYSNIFWFGRFITSR